MAGGFWHGRIIASKAGVRLCLLRCRFALMVEELAIAAGAGGHGDTSLSLESRPPGEVACVYLLLFLSPAFVVLLDPDAARLLAFSLVLCVEYPGKSGSGEGGCDGQSNERQEKPLHGELSLCGA